MSKRLGNTRLDQKVSSPGTVTEQDPNSKLHRCSFFPYQPAAINHLVATPFGCLPQVAVIRATEPTCLEIYTPSSDWAVERIVHGRAGENFECAVFVGPAVDDEIDRQMDTDSEDEIDISSALGKNTNFAKENETKYPIDTSKLNAKHLLSFSDSDKMARARLFTAGVDGRIREWSNAIGSLPQTAEIFSVDVNGGAIWSLAVSPDQKTLAVGCEDGRIRLFSIYDRSIEFLRGFEAIETSSTSSSVRILSLAWNGQGDSLISGSASGSIKIWNCQTGRPIRSIKLAELSFWSVAFCDSQSFVTGDSKGQVKFWDLASGTLLQSFPAFGADVLSVVTLQGRVFASGVDHKIVEFVQVNAPNAVGHVTDKWIQGGSRYFHTHDVRSLATLTVKYQKEMNSELVLVERQVLISGGVDCTLVISDPVAFDRALERNIKAFNSHQRRLLPFSRNSPLVQMARDVPVLAGRIGNCIQIWKLSVIDKAAPVHVADLKISRYEPITSFSISPSGKFVCILTTSEIKLFQVDLNEGAIHRIEMPSGLKISKKASFPHLAAFKTDSSLCLFNSQECLYLEVSVEAVNQSESVSLPVSACRVALNEGDFIAYSSDRQVYTLDSKNNIKLIHEASHPITAIAFLTSGSIAISDCRNGIVRISVDGKEVTETFSSLSKEWTVRKEPIMGIQSHPIVPGKISCWSDASIAQLTFPTTKRKTSDPGCITKLIDDYRPLLFFAHLPNSTDSVVIERPWISIVENFPPAFYRSRYGAQ